MSALFGKTALVTDAKVLVHVVAPGTTDTGRLTRFTNTNENKTTLVSTVPLKRLATPEEIAQVIAFVASAGPSLWMERCAPTNAFH
jgi:3-oxoacyl-[acyl-carrier protein] reductase